ncbi:zinc finger and BTB domain-containing protein 40-like isoform X1 [Acipenser ruthenus]|uniref:zinc finger and BTB domain-containing protein 40-like isoform X1 n=1 Tax=Acipenser ruthenus TaxID=7906 RepID=UPI0015607E5D|nr:zinc finger and BTB domain-containing protein 40-like isoform X1 [Acipenser ruthenus]XP_058849434.1 zinc finger and BTB domain-containing protein 40-like isoform X1 [Acipenser ruthenus]
MELPNYSRQLMQQLYTLRKEGQFCDCTILLGVTPYRAHKLVLAASSLLFKSLLENSETISIDPSVATSDEFANLLEMIYTGKLPPGKHNFTKVISIADSLQMFDVAVSCKNILNSLLKRSMCEQAEPSRDASCAEPAPDHTRDNQTMVPAAVTMHQSEKGAPELPTTLNFKKAQEDTPLLEEVHQQLSEIGDLERSTKPIFSAEVKDSLTEESGTQNPSEGSHEDSPPRKRCRLALSDGSEDDLEVLVQSRNRIAETIKDAQTLIHLVETCESLSSSEKQIILDCCKEDQVGPNVFDRLLNKVTDEKSLPVDTLLSVLDLLRDSYPELNNVLQTRSLREDSCAAQIAGAAPEERRFFDLLLAHVDELGDSVTELSPITECLEMATEGFLTELEKETVLECCKGVSPKEAIANLLNKVTTEKSVDQTSLLKLLHAVKEAFPNLQLLLERLEAEWAQRGGTEEKSLEEYGAELLSRYHENLCEILSEPQPLTDSLAAAGDIPTEEREFMKRMLEEDKDPGSFGRLISVVLEERSIQTLSVWRMLLRAQGGIPLLALLIEEIRRDPDADKLIQSVFDKESRALDILFRHKELVTETIDDLGVLLACVAQGVECPTGEVIEIIRNCCKKEGPRESVTNLLSKILEEKSISALPFCKLLCIIRESFPNLMPLIEELERAETETEEYAKGKLKKRQVSGAEMEVMLDEESSPSEVKEETQKRSSKQGFTCKWCDKSFEFKCRMEVHLKRCRLSSQAPVECLECGETVASLRALQLHTSQSHGDAPRKKRKQGAVTCDICGKSFAHQSGMLYHKRADHFDEKPYSCDQCGAKFAANSTLKNHKRLHTGERPFFCKHCDMMFTQAAALAYHTKKKHSEGKMYACQYCDNVFAQSIELTRHVRTHTGDKPYVCRECGKGFSQANGLSVHLHTFHNIEDPYDCQKCRMSFPTMDEHKKHIQVVHPREYYPCETCSKVFSASSVLERHMVTHVGGKPFKCEICNKAYQQLSGLWYHNRTHHPDIFAAQNHRSSKFASFPCSSCDKSFPNITSLKRHMKADHADAELYECQSCKEVFSTLGLLKKHTTTKHTGALQNHVGTEHFSHDGEAFRCGHCDLLLPSQQALEQHFQTQHPGAGLAQTPATAAQMVIQASEQTEVSEELIALEESQLGRSQVYVALADSQNNASGSEIVAVSMEDLLDGTVTLICGAEAQ